MLDPKYDDPPPKLGRCRCTKNRRNWVTKSFGRELVRVCANCGRGWRPIDRRRPGRMAKRA